MSCKWVGSWWCDLKKMLGDCSCVTAEDRATLPCRAVSGF